MPHSLRVQLRGLRYKGILEDKDYKRLCHALDLEKEEQETGHWIVTGEVDVYYDLPSYKCSKCGNISLENGYYCPNCGKKMKKEGSDE